MAEGDKHFELADDDQPPPEGGQPADAAPGPAGAWPKGKVDAEPLIDMFGDDEDLTADAPPGAVPSAGPPPSAGGPERETVASDCRAAGPTLVRAGWDSPRIVAIVAAVLAVVAAVEAWVFDPANGLVRTLLSIYKTGLHTGTGVAAIYASSLFLRRRFDRPEFAAARMLLAVAAFQALAQASFGWSPKVEELLLAGLAYVAVAWGLFRWSRRDLLVVVSAHAILALAAEVGPLLTQSIRGPAAP